MMLLRKLNAVAGLAMLAALGLGLGVCLCQVTGPGPTAGCVAAELRSAIPEARR